AIDNTLHVYTLLSDNLIRAWDVDSYSISLVCPPKIVKPLMQKSTNNDLKLNIHINLLHYYSHTGNYEGLDESYDYIYKYFYGRLSNADDYYNLARFSDLYSRFDHTTKVLKEGHERGVLDKRGVLHLCQNLVFF